MAASHARTKGKSGHRVYIRCMDNTRALLVVAVLSVPIAAQEVTPAPDAPVRISQEEFRALVAQENVTILDTRDEDAYRAGHIPGAIFLPLHAMGAPTRAVERTISRLKASTQPIVAYCACHGETSSLHMAALLAERGVPNVRALTGGWNDWFNDGKPIERGKPR